MHGLIDTIKSVLGGITFLALLPLIWLVLYCIRRVKEEERKVKVPQVKKEPSAFRKFIWFINGWCWQCGEEPEPHINGDWYCKNGHKC